MKQLSENEKQHYNDLEMNFTQHVDKYRNEKRQELQQNKKEELTVELQDLEEYYTLYMKRKVSDLIVNIDLCGAKIGILKDLLEPIDHLKHITIG